MKIGPGVASIMQTKNHVRLHQTMKTPYIQDLFCKIKRYTYNLHDWNISSNMCT